MELTQSIEKRFFSIGEISRITGIKPYVLRYWESAFGLLRPSRRISGQRKYTHKEIETINRIRELLYEKRFTIAGAKKSLARESRKGSTQLALELTELPAAVEVLQETKKEIAEILKILRLNEEDLKKV